MGNVVLQTDLCYSPSPVQERKENHPYYPHLVLLADKESGMIMDVEVYENKKEDANIVLNKLIDFFLDNGVPTKTQVQNDLLLAILTDLCNQTEFKLEKINQLDAGMML